MTEKRPDEPRKVPEPEFQMPGSQEEAHEHVTPPLLGDLVDDERSGRSRGGGSMEPMTGSNAGPKLHGV